MAQKVEAGIKKDTNQLVSRFKLYTYMKQYGMVFYLANTGRKELVGLQDKEVTATREGGQVEESQLACT